MNLRVLAVTLFAACAAPLYAHPGHSLTEHGFGHLLASPYHVLTLTVIGVALVAIAKMVEHRIASGFLTVAGVAAIAAAAVNWVS
jgi:hypothetical protein